jgi:type 1 glutamine amidotransferase
MDLVLVTDCAPYAAGASGVHQVLGQARAAFRQLARARGLGFHHVEDVTEGLPEAQVLVLFTIGDVPWSAEQRATIVQRIGAGDLHLLTVHSATDGLNDWPEYAQLTGGRFDGHPVTDVLALRVDRDHPATRHLPEVWHIADELYLFRELLPSARVLLHLERDEAPVALPGRPLPFAWCHHYGAGRCFTTALGHLPESWEDVAYVRHLDGALAWLLDGC